MSLRVMESVSVLGELGFGARVLKSLVAAPNHAEPVTFGFLSPESSG